MRRIQGSIMARYASRILAGAEDESYNPLRFFGDHTHVRERKGWRDIKKWSHEKMATRRR
jgi:hypothetical protein